jgi:hypothetical protein
VLALVGEPTDAVIAIVSSVEDVESARRFGARRAVVWAIEDVLFDHAPGAPAEVDDAGQRLVALLRATAALGGTPAIRVPERALSRRGEEWNGDAIRRVVTRVMEAVTPAGPAGPAGAKVEIVGEAGGTRWSGPDGAADASASALVVLDAAALTPRLAAAPRGAEIACPPALVPAARLALAQANARPR